MRDHYRAIVFLLGVAWKTDPWRTLGLLLEPVAFVRVPLFAYFTWVSVDAVTSQNAALLMLGMAGVTGTSVMVYVGLWFGGRLRARLSESVSFALNSELARLATAVRSIEHYERPDYQDRLHLLQDGQGVLMRAMSMLVATANVVSMAGAVLVSLALVAPWMLFLVVLAVPGVFALRRQHTLARTAELEAAPLSRQSRYLQGLAFDRTAGMEIRMLRLDREIVARFSKLRTAAQAIVQRAAVRGAIGNALTEVLFASGLAAALVLLFVEVGRGEATIGEFVMLVLLGLQVRSAVVDPLYVLAGCAETLRAAERMLWLKDYVEAQLANDRNAQGAPSHLGDGLVLDHVSFRYPNTDDWVLRDVTLRIPPGAVVALVGENGSGKTTLVKLLARLYDPSEGRILVDGIDLSTIDAGAWRRGMSAAFQDFARFEFRAQEVVGVGDLPRIDDLEAVRAGLERAGTDVFASLPQGGATQIGARWPMGVDLSVGQWQTMALGRALMRDQPLLRVFDEPTASLDAFAEEQLFDRYSREIRVGGEQGTTTILVSHRFTTVRAADSIVVLEKGRVIEEGTHADLLVRKGVYRELYEMQSRAYALDPIRVSVHEYSTDRRM